LKDQSIKLAHISDLVVRQSRGLHVWLPATEVLLVAGLCLFVLYQPGGMITRHMLGHIVLMSLIAPLIAHILQQLKRSSSATISRLWLAAFFQLSVFLLLHTPQAHAIATSHGFRWLAMSGVLLTTSVWFWSEVMAESRASSPNAIPVLLLTGKIVCLVAVLMVFAPRILYPGHTAHGLADQQLAGLIMLSVCPLTYIGAAVILTSRWFANLSQIEPERGAE
tara:strand:- start:8585 stop:9250 length:666 start_codon:yes stop_codon:yes gene_type:complete